MNSEEFLKLAIQSKTCPADFEVLYRNFQVYQELALETLKEIHRICEKNHITYSVSDGSLIGLVRNNGLIPWDYDIDLLVPLEEREKLVDAMRHDLDNKYYFYCPEVDNKCRHFLMRVAPVGYRTEELHVDIFYFIGAPDDEDERKRIAQRYADLVEHRYSRFVKIREASYGKYKVAVKLFVRKIKSIIYNITKEYIEFSDYAKIYPYRSSKYVLRADQYGWDKNYRKGHFRTYFAEDFNKTILYKSDIGEFRIIAGYHRFLTETYGDYMNEPSVENSIKEVVKSMRKLNASERKE